MGRVFWYLRAHHPGLITERNTHAMSRFSIQQRLLLELHHMQDMTATSSSPRAMRARPQYTRLLAALQSGSRSVPVLYRNAPAQPTPPTLTAPSKKRWNVCSDLSVCSNTTACLCKDVNGKPVCACVNKDQFSKTPDRPLVLPGKTRADYDICSDASVCEPGMGCMCKEGPNGVQKCYCRTPMR
jgi:hypothetical protein